MLKMHYCLQAHLDLLISGQPPDCSLLAEMLARPGMQSGTCRLQHIICM